MDADKTIVRLVLDEMELDDLNYHQKGALEAGLLVSDNFVCISPTGSGKTLMAAIRIMENISISGKVLYVHHLNATLNQNIDVFQKLTDNVFKLVGGVSIEKNIPSILHNHIVGVNPEKLYEFVLRYPKLVLSFDEVIFDEIHSISNPNRGPIYSILLSFFRSMQIHGQWDGRLLCLSGTYPNYEELKSYLQAKAYFSDQRDNPFEYYYVIVKKVYDILIEEDSLEHVETVIDLVPDGPESPFNQYSFKTDLIHFTEMNKKKSLDNFALTCLYFLLHSDKTLVMCASPAIVDDLFDQVSKVLNWFGSFTVIKHHGEMTDPNKFESEQKIKNDEYNMVISTTAISSGIDSSFQNILLTFDTFFNPLDEIRRIRTGNRRYVRNQHLVTFHQIIGRVGHRIGIPARVITIGDTESRSRKMLEFIRSDYKIIPKINAYETRDHFWMLAISLINKNIISTVSDITFFVDNLAFLDRKDAYLIDMIEILTSSFFSIIEHDKKLNVTREYSMASSKFNLLNSKNFDSLELIPCDCIIDLVKKTISPLQIVNIVKDVENAEDQITEDYFFKIVLMVDYELMNEIGVKLKELKLFSRHGDDLEIELLKYYSSVFKMQYLYRLNRRAEHQLSRLQRELIQSFKRLLGNLQSYFECQCFKNYNEVIHNDILQLIAVDA